MNTTYIMMKDMPVLEIENYTCRILAYDYLPISLRYEGVMYDDVMHGWTETRTMNIGRTNAKKILTGFSIRQSNPYTIAKILHFCSLTDCYWMKEKDEILTWKDVSLFHNRFEDAVSATALLGANHTFGKMKQRIHTPELTTQGMAAKAWVREGTDIYLYKVGKKELAASAVLDVLGIPHVSYSQVSDQELMHIADEQHIKKIRKADEQVVKCKLITSEEISMVSWEDFQIYCEYHQLNEYDYVKQNTGEAYYSMQIADYILGNDDRHGVNFGFFMDNATGEMGDLYPLMDHDHAFSDDTDIPSQTSEHQETLREAAFEAKNHVKIELSRLLQMQKPEQLSREQWLAALDRTKTLMG